MRCWFRSNPFAGVPQPLVPRAAEQLQFDIQDTFGLRPLGADNPGFRFIEVDLSDSSPARFMQFVDHADICRVDVTLASDLTMFAGRSPLTLGAIRLWQANPGSLSELQPGELVTMIRDLVDSALEGNPNSRTPDLDEALAVHELRNAGFDVPDEVSIDRAKPRELTQEDRAAIANRGGWDKDLHGGDLQEGTDDFGLRYNKHGRDSDWGIL
jgi:hypothetical protein